MKEELEKKLEEHKNCLWKEITEGDKIKRINGNPNVTLSEDKPCYACDGTREGGISLGCYNFTEI